MRVVLSAFLRSQANCITGLFRNYGQLSALELNLIKKTPDLYVVGKTAKEAMSPPLPVAILLQGHFQHILFSTDCQEEKQ
jgi:hypothetical protein